MDMNDSPAAAAAMGAIEHRLTGRDDSAMLVRGTAAGATTTPLPPALALRLTEPAQTAPTLDERFEALIQGYAMEIGACAMAGDVPGMERSQRFHQQVTRIRDHWRNGDASPVRTPRKASAAASVPADHVAVPPAQVAVPA